MQRASLFYIFMNHRGIVLTSIHVSRMKRIFIQVPTDERTKKAFSMWCEVNNTTMSEKIKDLIAPMVDEGELLLVRVHASDRPVSKD